MSQSRQANLRQYDAEVVTLDDARPAPGQNPRWQNLPDTIDKFDETLWQAAERLNWAPTDIARHVQEPEGAVKHRALEHDVELSDVNPPRDGLAATLWENDLEPILAGEVDFE